MSAVTSMLGNRVNQPAQQSGAPGPSPSGDLMVQGEAIRRVVMQMSKNDQFAPYGKRILDILDEGMKAAAGPQPGSPQAQPGSPAPGAAPGGAPAPGGSGFPG